MSECRLPWSGRERDSGHVNDCAPWQSRRYEEPFIRFQLVLRTGQYVLPFLWGLLDYHKRVLRQKRGDFCIFWIFNIFHNFELPAARAARLSENPVNTTISVYKCCFHGKIEVLVFLLVHLCGLGPKRAFNSNGENPTMLSKMFRVHY